MSRRRHLPLLRRVALVSLVIAGLGANAFVAAAWWVAVVATRVQRVADTYPLTVRALDPVGRTVTLSNGVDAGEPGVFRLAWQGGQTRVGRVVDAVDSDVQRQLLGSFDGLHVGLHVGIEVNPYVGNPATALGIAYRDVAVPTGLGAMPAWRIAGAQPIWAVLIHGLGGSRSDTLPVMPVIRRLGFPMLVPSYRNDVGAPASPDHRSHLGQTEWHDVAAAVDYAMAHGAHGVVLVGWSLGGGLAEQVARDPARASDVKGLILDSPLLDWRATIDYSASRRHLPCLFGDLVLHFLRSRAGLDVGEFDELRAAASLALPTLLIQGTADRVVPVGPADSYARAHPGTVTYLRVSGADHVSAVDVDRRAYDDAVRRFLMRFESADAAG